MTRRFPAPRLAGSLRSCRIAPGDAVELSQLHPGNFTLHTIPDRVERLEDGFAPLLQAID